MIVFLIMVYLLFWCAALGMAYDGLPDNLRLRDHLMISLAAAIAAPLIPIYVVRTLWMRK